MTTTGTDAGEAKRPPGRPRSERVRRSALAAALQILEDKGYAALTMEGIARDASASKQTLYRWWPSKAAIALEALNEHVSNQVPDDDRGNLEADVRTFLRRTVGGMTPGMRRILSGLMAQSQIDPAFAESFRAQFILRRRRAFQLPFERGRERGEVWPGADLELLADLAFGVLWYRILNERGPFDQAVADDLADTVLALARAVPATQG